jgi:hypothetical protein
VASIEVKAETEVQEEATEMTFSKTCQIETFVAPKLMKVMLAKEIDHSPWFEFPVELIACVCKAKHSLVVRSPYISNRDYSKFRLCDFHFDYLFDIHILEKICDEDKISFFKFRRNRL